MSIWSPCGAQFDEEFDEVLFSILAVDERIPYLNLRTLFPAFDGPKNHSRLHHSARILSPFFCGLA
jgi:hypothetical protein